MYPGAFNSQWEMQSFYEGLLAAGRPEAIQIMPWGDHLEQWAAPDGFYDKLQAWSEQEAQRIAAYRADHPGAPVTLLGYSSGALTAILVTERLPADVTVERVILMSAGVAHDYDLQAMLERVTQHVIVYWSPVDALAVELVGDLGTIDGAYESPAARIGFTTEHEKLLHISWEPGMVANGNSGDHLDYLRSPAWIRDTVAPWIATRDDDLPE